MKPSLIERVPGVQGQNISGKENVNTALSLLSVTMTLLFLGSRSTPRTILNIPFGPPMVQRGGTSPLSSMLHTPTKHVSDDISLLSLLESRTLTIILPLGG